MRIDNFVVGLTETARYLHDWVGPRYQIFPAKVEQLPQLEGKRMIMFLAPNKPTKKGSPKQAVQQ